MRIVYFDFNKAFGGGPQGSLHLAQRLSKENEVHIVDAYGQCEQYRDAVREIDLPYHVISPEAKRTYIGGRGFSRWMTALTQLPNFLSFRNRLEKKILSINPDIIWVMNGKSLTFLSASFKLRRYPIAYYEQAWATPDQVRILSLWLMKYRADAVIAISTATSEQLKLRGVPEDKIRLGSNTVDFEEVQKDAKEPLAEKLPGMDKYPKILLLAARPEKAKGHLVAYKALARLKKKGYDPALWMTGKVPLGAEVGFSGELKALALELDIKENVFFLGWVDNIAAVINACDITILPSHTEGFPRTPMEAMLLHRPVIATPVGGMRDSVVDGHTGLIFPVDDDEALAERLERVITDHEATEEMKSRAYDFVQSNFHPDEHTKRIMEIFQTAIQKKFG